MDNNTSNRENEVALIGACLRDSSRFDALADVIQPEDFSWVPYSNAWQAMKDLRDAHLSVDTVTLGDELDRKGKLQEFMYDGHDSIMWSGRAALSKIRESGDPRNVETYAQNVKDYSGKRQLLQIAQVMATWSQNGRRSADIIRDIQNRLDSIRTFDSKASRHTMTLAEAVSEAYDHTDNAAQGRIDFVATGYPDLDRLLGGGMTAPDLLILAARPGQGKTALLASIANNVIKAGRVPFIFSLEMLNRQIAMRLIAQESGVSFDKQKSGKLEDREWALYTNAIDNLSAGDKQMYLNDLPAISISRIRQELRRVKRFDVVMLDYIQLGGVDGKHDRRDQEIGEISRGLKSIAKEFEVPVLAAAQLNRAVEQRANKKPVLSDLRESGDLEQDADIVQFIYRPDDDQNKAELITAKHRNGPTGVVDLYYKPELTRFESASARIENFGKDKR